MRTQGVKISRVTTTLDFLLIIITGRGVTKKKSRPLFAADETMWLLTYYKQQNEWTKQSFAFYID
jgi:hypothetical protein